jgi:hypothetical protein
MPQDGGPCDLYGLLILREAQTEGEGRYLIVDSKAYRLGTVDGIAVHLHHAD